MPIQYIEALELKGYRRGSWLRRLNRSHLTDMIIGEPATNAALVDDDVKCPGENQVQVVF